MKKLISLILALCMACLMLPALAEEVTGDWYLTEILMGEESINPAAFGMNMVLTLHDDGTMTMAGGENGEEKGTWTMENGVVTLVQEDVEDTMVLSLEDGKLTASEDGLGMTFGREAPEAMVVPQPIAAQNEDAFLGTWSLSSISLGGMMVPAATFGMAEQFVIEPGKATETNATQETPVVTEYTTSFADGKLILSAGDDELPVELNDTGCLSITTQLDEETAMVLYLDKAE
ncbi:MAG: lipocalin family protein [Clostridia bacterium]|nr:lipocalin family protein [Clostridia bacterium]